MYRYIKLFIGYLVVKASLASEECKPRIAIIGAGIGGAAASHFLTALFNEHLEIDIYEANKIGGRLATIEMEKTAYEAGGSIIASRNRYMQDFLKLLGMEKRPTNQNERYGLWNGDEFVLKESSWEIITLAKLFFRYGIQPFKLYRYVNSMLNDFEKIYKLQDDGEAFENVDALLSAMNDEFPKLLHISTKDHLLNLGFSAKLIDELVEVTLVTNYGQDTNVQSFVGTVSVAGAGSGLWSVKGGNKEVPEHLVYRNQKATVVPCRVDKIRLIQPNGTLPRYEVHYTNIGSSNTMNSLYDIVILATPLTNDHAMPISFEGFPEMIKFPGKYQTTVATFVTGDLNPRYFGLEEPLDGILSCNPNKTKIHSVGRLAPVDGYTGNTSRVWKIFSKTSLTATKINNIFEKVDEVKEIEWKAYPHYATNVRFDKFKLHDFLYHVNAVEWAASAMEMSSIGGRNVAILSHKEFCSKCYSAATCDEISNVRPTTSSPDL